LCNLYTKNNKLTNETKKKISKHTVKNEYPICFVHVESKSDKSGCFVADIVLSKNKIRIVIV